MSGLDIDSMRKIVKEYKDGSNEPLDGDEVETLIKHLRNYINLDEGNITVDEFNELEGLI